MTKPEEHQSHGGPESAGQRTEGMAQAHTLRRAMPPAARECQKVRTAEATLIPDIEVNEGLYVGLDSRQAPHPNSSPYGRKAMQNVVAMARTVEDSAFRALDGEDPPTASMVECRLQMVRLIQSCLRCEPKIEDGESVKCAALEILATFEHANAPQGATDGPSRAEDHDDVEG